MKDQKMIVNAFAAEAPGAELKPFTYEAADPVGTEVRVKVEACGICYSDVSLWKNEWDISEYPLVPGHEVVGIVEATGPAVSSLELGDRVGIGWFSKSCMTCDSCMSGDHNLCASAEGISVGRYGGFADRVVVDEAWAVRVPAAISPECAGPLFCGGITVFNPILQCGVKPTDRVGVIGIGGLGHMALQFLDKWGCEVTALTSNPAKADAARKLGADHVVSSTDTSALQALAGKFDFLLVTVNVPLDWSAIMATLGPRGILHVVGAVSEPLPIAAFDLIMQQRSVAGTPLGSPKSCRTMLDFAARHGIAPNVETFPFNEVNAALAKLIDDKPPHRIVLVH
jgi:uncharacterized zinc-type alcohol dehydrogenase-like protein